MFSLSINIWGGGPLFKVNDKVTTRIPRRQTERMLEQGTNRLTVIHGMEIVPALFVQHVLFSFSTQHDIT
jgi:hypothetical protein